MKLHMVFSLNVTGSFVDDIFRVVRSIRFCLYGLSLGKLDVLEIISHLINMNDMIFLHFLAEKKKLSFTRSPSATNTTFLTQIYFPEGTQPNSRGWGTITSNPYSIKWKLQEEGRWGV